MRNTTRKGDPMKTNWYLPLAVLVGGAGLAVWTAATAAPPTAVTPGVKVVADVTPEDSPPTPGRQCVRDLGD